MKTDGRHRGPRDPRPTRAAFQYATRCSYLKGGETVTGRIERQPGKSVAEDIARDWVISPLRTGVRTAEALRRRGWDGEWSVIATWTSPEAQR